MRLQTSLLLAACALGAGCGSDDIPYEPKPAYTGTRPTMPGMPTLPNRNKKEGDAYTIWGASHDLRSRVHGGDFREKEISIVGYVVETNFDAAPECAIHKMGKADGADCKPPLPTFSIADSKEEKEEKIKVMGWASNFAQIYSMIEEIDGRKDEAKIEDPFLGVSLPNPLPAVGGKVKVTGNYGFTYTKSSGGTASNPTYGIITVSKIEWLEPPPEPACLRGMSCD